VSAGKGTMSGNAPNGTEELSFEEAFDRLQEAIGQLERGGLPLGASIATFERGMALAGHCAEILEAAELRVTRVLESPAHGLDEAAF
jgi:exodeoxyribonuclease VII small subunit